MGRLLHLRAYGFEALALALLVGAQIELWMRDPNPPLTYALATLLGTVPLVVRRVSPLGAPLLACAGGILSMLADAQAGYDSIVGLFILILAIWAGGQLERTREALLVYAAAVGTATFIISRFPDERPGDYLWVNTFLTAAWLASYVVGHRSRAAREVLERSEQERAAAIAAERRRIARELHDVVAHNVSVMTIQVGGVRRLLRPEQEREREALLAVERTGREALAEMRRLLGMLRRDESADLAPQPGVDRLEALVRQTREAGLPVEYEIRGDPVPLPPGIDVSAYRIVQEALTNALKHAGPARAEVVVSYGDDGIELQVANDGATTVSEDGNGQGLLGMRERVAVYGGTLEAGPRAGGGFLVRARLPVEE